MHVACSSEILNLQSFEWSTRPSMKHAMPMRTKKWQKFASNVVCPPVIYVIFQFSVFGCLVQCTHMAIPRWMATFQYKIGARSYSVKAIPDYGYFLPLLTEWTYENPLLMWIFFNFPFRSTEEKIFVHFQNLEKERRASGIFLGTNRNWFHGKCSTDKCNAHRNRVSYCWPSVCERTVLHGLFRWEKAALETSKKRKTSETKSKHVIRSK